MKKAFTLIELILVIVIIAILGGIGFSSMKSDYANKDGNFLLLKIKEARYKAIGFESRKPDGSSCVVVTRAAINTLEANATSPYKIRSNIEVTPALTNDRLCFDSFGKPYNGNAYDGANNMALTNLLHQNLTIKLTQGNDSCFIRVYSLSGYAIITCK